MHVGLIEFSDQTGRYRSVRIGLLKLEQGGWVFQQQIGLEESLQELEPYDAYSF